MNFLDSSLLARHYGRRVSKSVGAPPPLTEICVSELCRVEVSSAVRKRVREGTMDAHSAEVALALFSRDLGSWSRIRVEDRVLGVAAALVARHPLHSLDAIHLASALVASEGAPTPVRFGSGDARLNAAAKAEGLELLASA